MIQYTANIDAELVAPGVTVQVTDFDWINPHVIESCLPRYVFVCSISSTFAYSETRYSTDDASGTFAHTGNLIFVPANVHLDGRGSAGRARAVVCTFEQHWFEELTGIGDDWHPDMLAACVNIRNSRLAQAITRMGQEALAPGLACRKLTEGLGLLTAVEMARHLRSADPRSRAAGQTLTAWQMRRITDYIETLSGYVPDITELADLCGVSSRHLRRLFKQTTNQTIYEYAKDVWTAKAKRMLSDTELSLKAISAELGFSDAGSFSVAFRRATGTAPKPFRQQLGSLRAQ